MLRDDYNDKIVIDPYYPCIKHKDSADPKLDGTDYFIVAESMHRINGFNSYLDDGLDCSLSFTCEEGQNAFYKIIKDSLRFRIHEESFYDFRKHSWYSLIPGFHCEYNLIIIRAVIFQRILIPGCSPIVQK